MSHTFSEYSREIPCNQWLQFSSDRIQAWSQCITNQSAKQKHSCMAHCSYQRNLETVFISICTSASLTKVQMFCQVSFLQTLVCNNALVFLVRAYLPVSALTDLSHNSSFKSFDSITNWYLMTVIALVWHIYICCFSI